MKKLMTMIAVAATAFGLFADTPPQKTFSTSFEENDAETLEGFAAAGWTGAEDGLIKFADYDDDAYAYGTDSFARRTAYFVCGTDQAKYVALETGTNEVKHAVGDTFLDQLVKFTGFEDVQTNFEGDVKIAIWMKGIEAGEGEPAAGETNLYITAATVGSGKVEPVAFKIPAPTNETWEVEKWYRVTVKNIGDIYEANPTDTSRAGFIVYINGKQVGCEEAKGIIEYETEMTKAARKYMDAGQLFPAINTTDTNFNSVGYKGKGAIDDIIVDTAGPLFAQTIEYTFAINVDDVEGLEVDTVVGPDGEIDPDQDGKYTVADGSEVTITYVPAEGYKAMGNMEQKVTISSAKDVTPDSTIAAPAKVVATVANGGETDEYAECELYDLFMNDGLVDGDAVTFNVGGSVTNGEGEIFYDFTANTTIGVVIADAATTWNIQVNEIEEGSEGGFTDNVGVGAGNTKNITVATVDCSFTVGDGVTIAGTLKAEKLEISLTVALAGDGKILAKDGELLDYITCDEGTVVVSEQDEYGYYTYSIQAAAKTGTVIFICDKLGAPVTNEQEVGTTVALPAPTDPTQIRTFKGWFEEEALETPVTEPVTVIEGETKIWGKAEIEIVNNEIATPLDLQKLQAAVAEGNTFVGETLTQTAEIDLSAIDPWDGIGTSINQSGPVDETAATYKFMGTYDGAGNAITGVKLPDYKYCGLFNTTKNATFKNMNVTLASAQKAVGGIVGYAFGTLDISGTTVDGTITGTHKCGGFVCGSSSTLTFTDCTNKLDISTTGTGAAGFVAIHSGSTVTFTNCKNEGDISVTNTGAENSAAFLGYLQSNATLNFENCSNTGTLTSSTNPEYVATFVGRFQNCATAKAVNLGGCSAQASVKPTGACTVERTVADVGFNYATVSDTPVFDFATFVADDALEAGIKTYKLMSPGVTVTFAFNAVGSISFDTNFVEAAGWNVTATDGSGLVVDSTAAQGIVTWTATAPAPAEWPDPAKIPEGQTVAEAIPALAEGPLANANAKLLVTWAKGVGSVSFADAANIKADAYLLNIANDGNIDAAKAEFKVTISFDEDGKPVITTLPEGKLYNELSILGRQSLTTGEWGPEKDGDLFFKAELAIPTK